MQQPPQNPRRTPGMAPEGLPPTGAAKPGPLGPRVVTSEAARALTDMTEEMRKAQEAPPEATPEEPKSDEAKGEEVLKKEEPDFFESLRRAAAVNPAAVRDLVFAQRMGFLDSKERREKIEGRCKPIDFSEFVLRGEVTQEVWPWPNANISVTFRTTDVDDEIIIREYLSGGDYSQPLVGEVAQALLTLAAGIVKIGDQRLTEMPPSGCPLAERKKIFEKRMKEVKRPFVLIWDLYINYLWFGGRVREALYGKDANFRPVGAE